MQAPPAAGAGEEEALMQLLAQASKTPPGTDPYQAAPGSSYAEGLQGNPNLSANPFKGSVPPNTQSLIQQVMMEELNKPQPPPAGAPPPANPLPSQVKKPQQRR